MRLTFPTPTRYVIYVCIRTMSIKDVLKDMRQDKIQFRSEPERYIELAEN